MSVQTSALILDSENKTELGYMLDMPGFFMEWDKLPRQIRARQVNNLVKCLRNLGVSILCFPCVYEYFNEDEIKLIERKGINLLDGFRIRLCSLISVVRTIFTIVKKDLPFFKVGIWGADNEIGKIWAEILADEVNEMCIGGSDYRALNNLSSKIMKSTGLSCQVTNDASVCLKDKHIAVLAESSNGIYSSRQPSFNIISYRYGFVDEFQDQESVGKFYMLSGWVKLPEDLSISCNIKPWDEIGVIEGLFSIISKVYRNDILTSPITLKQLDRIKTLFDLYPLEVFGYMTIKKATHFDRLRMDYYRNRRKNLFKSNIIP